MLELIDTVLVALHNDEKVATEAEIERRRRTAAQRQQKLVDQILEVDCNPGFVRWYQRAAEGQSVG